MNSSSASPTNPPHRSRTRRTVGVVLLGAALVVAVFGLERASVSWVVGATIAGLLLAVAVRLLDRLVLRATRAEPYLVPTMLPPAPRPFVGRATQLTQVFARLSQPRGARPLVLLISGRAGVGKSAFAVEAAHELAEDFPDGQLFADCRLGANPTQDDIDQRINQVLGDFLLALQYEAEEVPSGRRILIKRYRELTRDRRVLVVLDDTDNHEMVEALTPAGGRCAVIVTCRVRPPWLPPEAELALDILAEDDALALLRAIAGDRINTEQSQAREIIARTGRHPLAVRAAATAIAARPKTSLTIAMNRLASEARGESAPEDPDQHALDFTYALLTDDEKAAVRMIGLLNLHEFPAWKIGALLNIDERFAEQLANRLVSSGLLSRSSEDAAGVPIFAVHDAVLRYAHVRYDETQDDTPRTVRLQEFAETSTRRRLLRVADLDLTTTVFRPLDDGSIFNALAAARVAVGQARDGEDPQAQGLALAALAEVQTEIGNADAAVDLAGSVLRDPHTTGLSHAQVLRCLGRLDRRHRRLDAASRHLTAALAAAESVEDSAERAKILAELAIIHSLNGARGRAVGSMDAAWAIASKLPDDRETGQPPQPSGRLYVETRLRWYAGFVYQELGDFEQALQALRGDDERWISRGLEPMLTRAWIAHRTGRVLLDPNNRKRDPAAALAHATEGQELFGAMNHRYGKAHCRNIMGQACLAAGRVGEALSLLERALENFSGCGDRWEEGASALVLAGAYASTGRDAPAVHRLGELALNIFDDLGDTTQVRLCRKLLDSAVADPPIAPPSMAEVTR